ncbi:MAG TPA: hypothetical protein VFE52_07745 [Devosia sp.]|jgi:hypothetical protein|nr:hypothetical protein [Devosia sp.]
MTEREPLSFDEFTVLADRLGVDRDVREELYPSVRDLLLLTDMLNRLAPELSKSIPAEGLTVGVSTQLR